MAESAGIFLSNRSYCPWIWGSVELTHSYLFLHQISTGPVETQKKLMNSFNGTHFVSLLSNPILCLHTVEATIDSGMNGVGIQNSNT